MRIDLDKVNALPAPEKRKFWALAFKALQTGMQWSGGFKSTNAWIKAEEKHSKAMQEFVRFYKANV